MNHPYKLIAFDLDGTVLPMVQTTPSDAFCRLQAQVAGQGLSFAIFTGRTIATIPPMLLELPGLDYICYNNGAGLVSWPDGQLLYKSKMAADFCLRALEILRDYPVLVQLHSDRYMVLTREVLDNYPRYNLYSHHVSAIQRGLVTGVEKLEDFVRSDCHLGIDKVNVVNIPDGVRQELVDRLMQLPEVAIVSSGGTNLEINMRHTDKGRALAFLAQHMGIGPEAVLAMGDNDNDAQMLAFAGLGVCMGDGSALARQSADVLTGTQAEDGAAMALEKYLL